MPSVWIAVWPTAKKSPKMMVDRYPLNIERDAVFKFFLSQLAPVIPAAWVV